MRIPESFKIAGLTINVTTDNELVKRRNVIGEARYSEQSILIDRTAAPAETTEQAFLHEAIHWVFYILNEEELRNNEKLVDTMAHLLYQIMTTAKHTEE